MTRRRRAQGVAADNRALGRQMVTHRAPELRRRIKLKQDLDDQILEIVRDLLLAGDDVDAIALLARELDLHPKPHRWGAWPFVATVPGNAIRFVMERFYTDDRYALMPRKLVVSDDTAPYFVFDGIRELSTNRLLLDRSVSAMAFRGVRSMSDIICRSDGLLEIVVADPNRVDLVFPIPLPFSLVTRLSGIQIEVSNLSNFETTFEGFLLGELWTPEEWRSRNPRDYEATIGQESY